ncbi:hypothetical protein LINPERHAP2_LOCUS30863 [Linum perenne]
MAEQFDYRRSMLPGPENPTVLYDQANHRSEEIWKNPAFLYEILKPTTCLISACTVLTLRVGSDCTRCNILLATYELSS